MSTPRRQRRSSKGLILLTLAVLGGLAGVLVPGYFRAARDLKRQALQTDLEYLNNAANRFRDEHAGSPPGLDDTNRVDEDRLIRHLTLPTDAHGQVLPGGPCGPYLKVGIPPNPWNGSAEVKIVTAAAPPQPDGSTGWIFHVVTPGVAEFSSNAREGAD